MDLMPDRMGFFAHENSVISELEADHKMDKKLKIADIAARTGLSPSTVSRVLAGKANTSARAREQVLACARDGWHGSRSYVAEQPDYFRAATRF